MQRDQPAENFEDFDAMNNKPESEFTNFDAMRNNGGKDFNDFGAKPINEKNDFEFNNFFGGGGEKNLEKNESKGFEAKFSDNLDFLPAQKENDFNHFKSEKEGGFDAFSSNQISNSRVSNQKEEARGASKNLFERNDFFDDHPAEDLSQSIVKQQVGARKRPDELVERPRISDGSFERDYQRNDKFVKRAVDFDDIHGSHSELGNNHSKASFREIFDDKNSHKIDPKSLLNRLGNFIKQILV